LKISNKNKKNNSGFTLIELVLVIGGLAALASLSLPSFLRSVKYNKIEEAKALMNGYALDCIREARIYEGLNLTKKLKETVPFNLSNERLEPLGYKIDGNFKNCLKVSIKALNQNEEDLYPFEFSYNTLDQRIEKVATPTDKNLDDHSRIINRYSGFLNSCKGWAGENCGLTEEQKAEIARKQAIAEARDACNEKFEEFKNNPGTGETTKWDDVNNSCTIKKYCYKGSCYNSPDEVVKARDAELDGECNDWRTSRRDSKEISPNGNPETIDACAGNQFWFHSGEEFTNQTGWNNFDDKVKKDVCEKNRGNLLERQPNGDHQIGPGKRPVPCGDILYFCNGIRLQTRNDYLNTSCGTPPPPPPPPPPPERCNRSSTGICKMFPSHPVCGCK